MPPPRDSAALPWTIRFFSVWRLVPDGLVGGETKMPAPSAAAPPVTLSFSMLFDGSPRSEKTREPPLPSTVVALLPLPAIFTGPLTSKSPPELSFAALSASSIS